MPKKLELKKTDSSIIQAHYERAKRIFEKETNKQIGYNYVLGIVCWYDRESILAWEYTYFSDTSFSYLIVTSELQISAIIPKPEDEYKCYNGHTRHLAHKRVINQRSGIIHNAVTWRFDRAGKNWSID